MNKRIIFLLFFLIAPIYVFSQFTFSGGNGGYEEPYLISTLQDLKDFHSATTGQYGQSVYCSSNYIQTSDISIPIAEIVNIGIGDFSGQFNGRGFSLIFFDSGADLPEPAIISNRSLFHTINDNGRVDSIVMSGLNYRGFKIVQEIHGGILSNCINYSQQDSIYVYDYLYEGACACFVDQMQGGIMENCINYADIYGLDALGSALCQSIYGGSIVNCKNYGNIYNAVMAAGICGFMVGDAVIENCINYGNIYTRSPSEIAQLMSTHNYDDISVGGIAAYAQSSSNVIRNCQNYGTIVSEKFHTVGGIYGGNRYYPNPADVEVKNCANYGHLYNGGIIGGIVGNTFGSVNVYNCYNAGDVYGYGSILASENATSSEVRNCLSVYGRSFMARAADGGNFIAVSNFYDRQMASDTIEDVAESVEGRLTSQLVGDTPELRAMLGEGWSYADGRYPIPIGLENDSLAMLFATPIYLYGESVDNYDNVNLVRHNFIVGTENEVEWASDSLLLINGETATILASGRDTVIVSLAGYSFSRAMNLVEHCAVVSCFSATACDSYEWNGISYTSDGDYVQILTASNSCDSIVTLHLTINNSVHYSFTEAATSPYNWNGTEYTETGDYTQTFTAENGCDSIVTLHLNILSGISQNGTAEISVFPTPTTDILNITSSETISKIEIVNVMGQVVKRMEVNTDNAVCDVKDLRSGVYVVRIHAASTTLSLRRFVKE
ncbi:MAG: T9SS type A sorting domain-containing protein [Bacteroidales bacterium]|nr:T9SS type A sorting domain-containing protein [Bacteroidales bacterium]